MSFYCPCSFQELFLAQSSAVHLSSPVHQIVGFINEKYIIAFHPVSEESFQMDLRIKCIIVIADYPIHPGGRIQTHFIRTDLVFLRLGQQVLSKIRVSFCQQFKHCLVHPVKMSFGIRTLLRIAVRLL